VDEGFFEDGVLQHWREQAAGQEQPRPLRETAPAAAGAHDHQRCAAARERDGATKRQEWAQEEPWHGGGGLRVQVEHPADGSGARSSCHSARDDASSPRRRQRRTAHDHPGSVVVSPGE
jgi:hypothetical protein